MGHGTVESGIAPSVFISYRRLDTEGVARLAEQLREDLGRENVFRDLDDLIGGEDWETVLSAQVEAASSVIVVIGPNWEAVGPKGEQPLTDPKSRLFREISESLSLEPSIKTCPVLVDREMPEIPTGLAGLKSRHAVSIESSGLTLPDDAGYPKVLASVWNPLVSNVPGGVLVVADRSAEVKLREFVRSLQTSKLIDARFLSQYGANTCVISPRQRRRKAREWPDAIVLVDDSAPSRYLDNVLTALDEHPGFKKVAAVGVGAATAGATLGGVAVFTQAQFAASVPGGTSGAGGAFASMSIAAKVGTIAAGGAVVVGGAAVAVNVLPENEAQALEFDETITLDADDEGNDQAYPLADPPTLRLELSDPVESEGNGDVSAEVVEGFVSRDAVLFIEGIDEPVASETVIIPTGLAGNRIGDLPKRLRLAQFEASIPDLIRDIPVFGYCYRISDDSDVVGGWRFTGEDGTITVTLVAEIDDDNNVDPDVNVRVEGTASRVLLDEVGREDDLSQCPEVDTGAAVWADD